MHTLTDIYKHYRASTASPVDKATFKNICEEFNMSVIENLILEGKSFNMRSNLSNISVRRIERNPSCPTIDWWESNKYKQELIEEGVKIFDPETGEGKKWFIYYTDPWYCKYHWEKHKCKIPNKTVYRFTPTRGLKGNKEKLTALLKEDELAYLKFKKHGNI
jgi:hypothetical protein